MDGEVYSQVLNLLAENKSAEAQTLLDGIEEKDAEWHYLSSRVCLAKKWNNESRKELEKARKLDPKNKKYKNELKELDKYIKGLEKKPEANGNNMGGSDEAFCSGCTECCCGLCGG